MPDSARRARQVVRLLGILRILLDGSRPTVHELAARFHTRRETIYRDLRALGEAGYPIAGDDAGHLSRPRLALGSQVTAPPVTLTRRELAALVWAARRADGAQPFPDALDTGLTKLQSLVPRGEGRLGLALDGAVEGWERGVKDYAGFGRTILGLVRAIVERRRAKVAYRAPGRAEPRRFPYDPYRLLSVHGGLYVIGKVPAYSNLATLAIDRIEALDLLEETFTVDPAFDPKRYRAEAFGVVWEKPVTVVLRFRADQAPYVTEREWHPTQHFRRLRDGRLEMTFRAGGRFEMTRWILGWGDAVEVVRPVRLRRSVGALIRAAARQYAGASRNESTRGRTRA